MKVLHICSFYSELYKELILREKKKIETEVFHFTWDEKNIVDEDDIVSEVCFSKWDRLVFNHKEKKVKNVFDIHYKGRKFDLIHAHTTFSDGYIAYKNYKENRTPYIVTVRNTDLNVFFKYRIFLRKIGCEILKNATRIIFLSAGYRDKLIDKYLDADIKESICQKSLIIPNGISDFFINNLYREKSNMVQDDELKLLFVGEICSNKNQLMVCDLVDKLNEININTSCRFIGKVVEPHIKNKMLKREHIEIFEPMPREKLIDEYRRADIYVMPSHTETFGLTYAEAMSQGVPIIYTRGQGFDEQFADGVVGYATSDKDLLELVQHIIDCKKNYATLSKNCLKYVDRFSWNKICDIYVSLYEEILHEKECNHLF